MKIADFFYTVQQAAEQLNVNRITIWRWLRNGRITAQQVGRESLIPKEEIDRLKVQAK